MKLCLVLIAAVAGAAPERPNKLRRTEPVQGPTSGSRGIVNQQMSRLSVLPDHVFRLMTEYLGPYYPENANNLLQNFNQADNS